MIKIQFDGVELWNGDCLELMKNIPDESVDMILCDLPYGTTKCEFDIRIPFEPLWNQYNRVIKNNGAIVLFSDQPFTTDLINSQRKLFRYEIIWAKTQKTGFLNANKMPLKAHENILVFYKHLPTYNPQKYIIDIPDKGRVRLRKDDRAVHYDHCRGGSYTDTGQRYPSDIIEFSNWNGALFGKTDNAVKHPTQKPVPLLEYLIKTYSNQDNLVLDNCMGGGSTGVACVNTNRRFIGIEIDEHYYDVSVDRIKQAMEVLNGERSI